MSKGLYITEPWRLLGDIMSEGVIVKAKIKEYSNGLNVAGDFAPALNKKVEDMLETAVARAKANGRRTIMAKDL